MGMKNTNLRYVQRRTKLTDVHKSKGGGGIHDFPLETVGSQSSPTNLKEFAFVMFDFSELYGKKLTLYLFSVHFK